MVAKDVVFCCQGRYFMVAWDTILWLLRTPFFGEDSIFGC